MSLFRDFEAELDRQRGKLAESWSVLNKAEYHHFDAQNYDVPRFQTMEGKVDIHSVEIKRRENLADHQIELVGNILERMKIASELLLAQMAYGLKASPSPEDLIETMDQDFDALQLMSSRREKLRTGRFHPEASDVNSFISMDALLPAFKKIARDIDRFQSGTLPKSLLNQSEDKLLTKIFELRADFANASMEHAEIRHGRADHLIGTVVALKKWAIEEAIDKNRIVKLVDNLAGEAADNLEAVTLIHGKTQKFMNRLFEMIDGQTFATANPTRYEPSSIKTIVDPAP